MGTPADPEKDDAEGVSLSKGDPASEAPFDPYRFGMPDHPIPAEYAPPGYTGPVVPPPAPYPSTSNPWAPPGEVPPQYGQQPPSYPRQSPYGPPPPGLYPPYPNPYGAPYGGPTGPYGYPQPKAGTNGLAIASFVLAFLCSIAGLVCGIIALNQISQRPQPGKGLAIAGVVISVLSMIAGLVFYAVTRK